MWTASAHLALQGDASITAQVIDTAACFYPLGAMTASQAAITVNATCDGQEITRAVGIPRRRAVRLTRRADDTWLA